MKYDSSSARVTKSNTDNILINTVITKVNGNTIGKKYLGIESLLYFSKSNYCTLTLNNNSDVICYMIEFEKSKLLHDKALSNVSILNRLYLT